MRRIRTIPAILLLALIPAGPTASHPYPKIPDIVLWAWERPENLSFIDPQKVAVAFLARSIELSVGTSNAYCRTQPLSVPKGTTLIAVVRITTNNRLKPSFSEDQRQKLVSDIISVGRFDGVNAIQIDFDAKGSERSFYRKLLNDLHCQLPDTVPLSITALASWCIYDTWISDLPVDDAVPMLFRLGADRYDIIDHIGSGKDFGPAVCRQSIGISTDESFPRLPGGRRMYIFNPRPWTPDAFNSIMEKINR